MTHFNLFGVLLLCSVLHVCVAAVADWSSAPLPSISLLGDDCLSIRWSAVTSDGGAPVLCYEVERGENSVWYTIVDCGSLGPGVRHTRTCGFVKGVPIQFKVYAINSVGVSLPHATNEIYWEWLLAGSDSVIQDPGLSSSHTSGAIPSLMVRSYFASSPTPVLDSISTDKVFVAQLVARCKLDPVSTTATLPLAVSDAYYVSDPEVDGNALPAFTVTLLPSNGAQGLYFKSFSGNGHVLAGEYSLLLSALEPGGLLGQYWGNPFFSNLPNLQRKDETIDFQWNANPILNTTSGVLLYDLVSIRWSGFVSPEYRELYQFTIVSTDYMQIWFDEVLVVDQLLEPCVSCAWASELKGPGHYHHIRIDYYHSKGFDQLSSPASISLKWSSYSQLEQVIPPSRLFKGVYIGADPVTGSLRALTFVADILDGSQCVVTLPSSGIVAGEVVTVFVQSRDAFGQDRLTVYETFFLTLDLTGGPTLEFSTLPEGNGKYVSQFVLTVAGTYLLTIVDQDGNAIRIAHRMEVEILPAEAVSVSVVSVAPTVLIASEPITVTLALYDIFGNALDGTPTVWPEVYVTAEWFQDETSVVRLGGDFVDFETRNSLFGTFMFTNDSPLIWEAESGFTTSMTINLSGEFHVGFSANAAPITDTADWVISANPMVAPTNSVIVSKPFVPLSLIAGEMHVFEVQVRDAFLGVIDLPVKGIDVGLGSVRIQLGAEHAFCPPKVGSDGLFVCSLSPILAHSTLLSIFVNGEEASFIPSQAGGPLDPVPGPFTVLVVPGPVYGGQCLFTDYSRTYPVGIYSDSKLVLRDSKGNNLNHMPTDLPAISVEFIVEGTSTVAYTLDANTFVFNDDGSVTIPMGSMLVSPAGGWELKILVNSVQVLVPPTSRIIVVNGLAKAAQTVCTSIGATQEAGVLVSRTCQPNDVGSNAVDRSGLHMVCSHKHVSDQPLVDVVGTYNGGGGNYGIATTLNIAGTYSVYCALGQQGGLFGEYFETNDFLNLILVDPKMDPRHASQPVFTYNQIDYSFVFNELNVLMHGVRARSIRWSGLLVPPAAITVRFKLVATGGARIRIGNAVFVDKLNEADNDLTFDVAFASTNPVEIVIEYVPGVIATFEFTWAFPSFSSFAPLHANSLLALLHVLPATELITVSPSVLGSHTQVHFPPSMTNNVADSFTIEAKDRFGNLIPDEAPCFAGVPGTTPSCLFDIQLHPNDGSVFAVTFMGSGMYQVDVTMNTDGSKLLYVSIITGANPGDRDSLASSPLSIVVT